MRSETYQQFFVPFVSFVLFVVKLNMPNKQFFVSFVFFVLFVVKIAAIVPARRL
jgi:hypothetical protein